MIISALHDKNEYEIIVENENVVKNEDQALDELFKVTAVNMTFKLVYKAKDFYQFKSHTGHEFTVKNNNKRGTIRGFYLPL